MKAFHYFILSSKQIVKEAHHSLGNMYYYGQYVGLDVTKAIYHKEKASNQNFARSQYDLYSLYMNDPNFQKINKAIYHLQLEAYNNYADAQLVMGDYYLCGDFFPKNINKAIE